MVVTVLGFAVFYCGGDVGVNVFIITLSIIPGAIVDQLFFGHHLNLRQWLGVGVGILGGYAVLGTPSLQELKSMPLWVWLSFGVMLGATLNQVITQKIRKADIFLHNFWGGLMTVVLCLTALSLLGQMRVVFTNPLTLVKLLVVSFLIGLVVVMMWSFNLLSYKGGASIALKKLVMNGTYLVLAMLGGMIFFGEILTKGKVSGVILYLIAFGLMDDNTWRFLIYQLKSKA